MMARILIVDDEAYLRLLYRELLEEEGHEVSEAENGLAALDLVRQQSFDLVILDVNMPGLDGLQVLRRLHDIDRRLPVILNSAYAAYNDQFVSWLADAYLTKSSRIDEVLSTVNTVLERHGKSTPAKTERSTQ